jgi:ABC-2 type transport system ATP-binding protein
MNVWEYLEFTSRVRGLDPSTFRSRLKKVVEVCGLAQVLGKDIGTLSHGYRQRVGLGQALMHDPPILILDEPTSDLDPNEKAEVIQYIQEIGKNRTILLSTHNLAEVEQACARAIIVSKGRVVADGNLADIRARAGAVTYLIGIAADAGLSESQAQAALSKLPMITRVRARPGEDGALRFELSSKQEDDARRDIFQLAVAQGWVLIELRREAQSLDSVFHELTRGDEKLDRGREWRGQGAAAAAGA